MKQETNTSKSRGVSCTVMSSVRALASFGAVVGLLAWSPLAAEQTVSSSINADPDAIVQVSYLSGTVRITGGSNGTVEVSGTVGDDAELDIDGRGDQIDIEVDIPERRRNSNIKVAANLEIQVPRGASVEVETLSGTIDISGINGSVEVETMSGNVTVSGSPSTVSVEGVSGSINISGSRSSTEAESVSGKIMIEDVEGDIQAAVVNGEIEIRNARAGDVEIEGVNTSIVFEGSLGGSSRMTVESYVGNVELILGDSAASFSLETLSGEIDNQLTSDKPRSDRYEPGERLEFETGRGDARVDVETVSGRIVLRP